MSRPPISRARPWTPSAGAFVGWTFRSERQYRNALARAKGFPSWSAQQRAPRVIRDTDSVRRLRPSEALARRQALEALSLMRREGLSLQSAAARASTTANAVTRHVGPALVRLSNGRYRPTRDDRLFRPLVVLTIEGLIALDLVDSGEATVVGQHWAAIARLLETGDATALRSLQDRRVAGFVLETDPDVIEELAHRGELSFEDIYRS